MMGYSDHVGVCRRCGKERFKNDLVAMVVSSEENEWEYLCKDGCYKEFLREGESDQETVVDDE